MATAVVRLIGKLFLLEIFVPVGGDHTAIARADNVNTIKVNQVCMIVLLVDFSAPEEVEDGIAAEEDSPERDHFLDVLFADASLLHAHTSVVCQGN